MMFARGSQTAAFWALALASFSGRVHAEWPGTPLYTSGRDIYTECGEKVVFAGVNWPGAGETMLPEGLQYSSISDTVSKIKSLGMNIIRLTYAMEMIDDHFDDSPNQSLNATLANALGADGGAKILAQILDKNPQFTAETTRLDVFDAVAEECANQEIWVHLDNHVSRASWCCLQVDGNAWFGDKYFDVYNWTRGLGFLADHTKSWDALASMALRNELRPPVNSPTSQPYDWPTWLANMVPAAEAIYGNNTLPLIFFSGIAWDDDGSFMASGENINGSQFTPTQYDFAEKIVLEIHNYANNVPCDAITPGLDKVYTAMNLSDTTDLNKAPVVLSEFGFSQSDGSDELPYAQCLKNYVTGQPGGPGGWMQWVLAGGYYIKYGAQDPDETWGLLSHDWSSWRNQTVIDEYVKPFVQESLA